MKVKFDVKYGKNVIELILLDGTSVRTEFIAKYGKNKVIFPTIDRLTVEFDLKYGNNIVEADVTEETKAIIVNKKLTNLFEKKVTIYNSISIGNTGSRYFKRFVINRCQITGQLVDKASSTIRNILNADTVITKDVEHYKEPSDYIALSEAEQGNYYTAQPGDFIVFDEADEVITNAAEFAALQLKYKHCGIIIMSVSANINGMAVDNVMMTNI